MAHFSFTNNTLSKSGYLKGLVQIMLFQSMRNAKKSIRLLADYFSVLPSQLFFFSAGRMSVYALLKSLKLKQTDEVIVAGYTCVVLTNAVKFANCRLKYVDIEKQNLNINPALLLNAVSESTKVIIVPHNFGIPFEHIKELKEKFPSVIIVEDAAHCFGSTTSDGQLCGTIGDVSFFSLEYSKPLTTGLGGIMIINNKDLLPNFTEYYKQLKVMKGADIFRMICTLGVYNLMFSKKTNFFQVNGERVLRKLNLLYRTSQKEIDGEIPEQYPTKLNPKLSCFLSNQLKDIQGSNEQKKKIVSEYDNAFSHFKNISCSGSASQVLVRYPIVFNEKVDFSTISAIKSEAASKGYHFGQWFNDVVHPKGSYRYDYSEGSCPVGEFVSERMINLPVNANYPLTKNELEEVISLFEKHGIN